jgi:hypothetical protein
VSTKYIVTVSTSDIKYAGTDANVKVTLFGSENDTGEVPLARSENHKNMWCDDFLYTTLYLPC